jgi:hypothetical protein
MVKLEISGITRIIKDNAGFLFYFVLIAHTVNEELLNLVDCNQELKAIG